MAIKLGLLTKKQAAIIMALLSGGAIEGYGSFRFNELSRTLKELGEKIPTPTLIRNLRKLENMGFVSRKEKGKQHVSYCLRVSTSLMSDFKALGWYSENKQSIDLMTFDRLSACMMGLVSLRGLELLNLRLKKISGVLSTREYTLKAEFSDSFYLSILNLLLKRSEDEKERFKDEFESAIADIDSVIRHYKADLFPNRRHT